MKSLGIDVLIVIPQLGVGGGEKVACNLANSFSRRGLNTCILVYKKNANRDYQMFIDSAVHIKYLDYNKKIRTAPVSFFYRLINNINVINPVNVIFCSGTLNCVISFFLWLLNKSIKKIARETNLPSYYSNLILRFMYKMSYHHFDEVIVQSKEMRNDILKVTKCKIEQIKLVNNPVEINKVQKYSKENADFSLYEKHIINIVSAGRLTVQKGYDLLIKMIRNLKKGDLNVGFHILGTGELEEELKLLVDEFKLTEQVHFYGNIDNPYPYYRKADAFISPSRWEGFPNAVVEAIACGTPVIANNYPGGLTEIITEENGVIIDITDTTAFKMALDRVMQLDNLKISSTVKHLDALTISKLIIYPDDVNGR